MPENTKYWSLVTLNLVYFEFSFVTRIIGKIIELQNSLSLNH